MIKSGEKIPSVNVHLVNDGGTTDADSAAIFADGKSVLFTVPGAYTPTCHNNHLPGYVVAKKDLNDHGFNRIVCMTVNDHHVVSSWAASTNALDSVEFIADGNADLTKAMGLDKDFRGGGMGTRAARAALIINGGVVEAVFTEDNPGEVTSSGAPAILEFLNE